MDCVLAVDGGNTKTIALVATLDGVILGAGRGGCGDIYNVVAAEVHQAHDPGAAALENVERAVAAALQAANIAPAALRASVFNMAGADWPEDIAFWAEAMAARGMGRAITVQNDALGVLYLASRDAVGVSIVCGTGAATGARSPDGRVWHSSFWQDEVQGSGQLGQKALFAVYRSHLGIEPQTSLTARVLEHFSVATVAEVLHLFHNRHVPAPASVDRLTPLLLDEAHAGDEVALRVVREHGAALAEIALAAARHVGLLEGAFPLILAGGVFRHATSVLEDAIVARVRSGAPEVQAIRTEAEPVIGVLYQALATAGVVRDQRLEDRVESSAPAALVSATITA
jgi:N-acetylglucosamine kinase-like BadF-type ATPase